MKRYYLMTLFAALALGLAPANLLAAKPDAEGGKTEKKEGAAGDARIKELQEKFKQRYEQVHDLKKQGVVGETYEGYLDFVKDKGSAGQVVDDENADRKELYKLIAEKEGTTPEKVAERNAKRNFSKAATGDFLKGADGKWQKKA